MLLSDWLRLILLSLLWGGAFFFVEVAVPHMAPMTIVLTRVALGAGLLALILLASGTPFPRGLRVWAALGVMGGLNNALPFTLFAAAQGQIDSGLAAILNASTPLWAVVVAHAFTADDRITRHRLAGLAVGFAGVVVLMGGAGTSGTLAAQGACLLAALLYGLAGVWARRFAGLGLRPMAVAFGQTASASVILLPLVVWFDRPWTAGLPPVPVIGALLALASLSTALAYLLYFRLIASSGAVNASLVTLLIPVSAIALGASVLGEALEPRHFAGMALIGTGLAVLDGRLVRWVSGRVRTHPGASR
jgi:drug/metabolite transporter (DMT)-like permease